jgi:hypothetical protein
VIARIKREGAGFLIEIIGEDYDSLGGKWFVKEIEYVAETHVERINFTPDRDKMWSGKIPLTKSTKKIVV